MMDPELSPSQLDHINNFFEPNWSGEGAEALLRSPTPIAANHKFNFNLPNHSNSDDPNSNTNTSDQSSAPLPSSDPTAPASTQKPAGEFASVFDDTMASLNQPPSAVYEAPVASNAVLNSIPAAGLGAINDQEWLHQMFGDNHHAAAIDLTAGPSGVAAPAAPQELAEAAAEVDAFNNAVLDALSVAPAVTTTAAPVFPAAPMMLNPDMLMTQPMQMAPPMPMPFNMMDINIPIDPRLLEGTMNMQPFNSHQLQQNMYAPQGQMFAAPTGMGYQYQRHMPAYANHLPHQRTPSRPPSYRPERAPSQVPQASRPSEPRPQPQPQPDRESTNVRKDFPGLASPEPHGPAERPKTKKAANMPLQPYSVPAPSKPWGALDRRGLAQFMYNPKHVELELSWRYSKDQLMDFFRGKWPSTDQTPPNRTQMTLWIQNPPSGAMHRCVSGSASQKCRWEKCPDAHNTILKGFWRVALDERSDRTGTTLDPHHNAGYLHLYCLEKMFDLAELINYGEVTGTFRVRPELRTLPKETRNPMALDRDHSQLVKVYEKWLTKQTQLFKEFRNKREGMPACRRPYRPSDCLWRSLTDAHLDLEGDARHQSREERGGAHICKHRGDLEEYLEMKRAIRAKHAESDNDEQEVRPVSPVRPQARRNEAPRPHTRWLRSSSSRSPTAPADPAAPVSDARSWFRLQRTPPSKSPSRSSRNRPSPLRLVDSNGQGPNSALLREVRALQNRPATRKRSRDVIDLVEREAQGHVTRSRIQALSPLLDDEALREQVSRDPMAGNSPESPLDMALFQALPRLKRRKIREIIERESSTRASTTW